MPRPGQTAAEVAAAEALAAREIGQEGQAALQRSKAGAVRVGNLRTRRGILSTLQSVAHAKASGDVSSKSAEAWARLLGRALQALDQKLTEREEHLAELDADLEASAPPPPGSRRRGRRGPPAVSVVTR